MSNDDSEIELMSQEEILKAIQTEADHKGNSTQLLKVNNELIRIQTQQQQRLENEIEELTGSLDSYRRWSKGLTLALIFLSLVVILLTAGLLAVEIGLIG